MISIDELLLGAVLFTVAFAVYHFMVGFVRGIYRHFRKPCEDELGPAIAEWLRGMARAELDFYRRRLEAVASIAHHALHADRRVVPNHDLNPHARGVLRHILDAIEKSDAEPTDAVSVEIPDDPPGPLRIEFGIPGSLDPVERLFLQQLASPTRRGDDLVPPPSFKVGGRRFHVTDLKIGETGPPTFLCEKGREPRTFTYIEATVQET